MMVISDEFLLILTKYDPPVKQGFMGMAFLSRADPGDFG